MKALPDGVKRNVAEAVELTFATLQAARAGRPPLPNVCNPAMPTVEILRQMEEMVHYGVDFDDNAFFGLLSVEKMWRLVRKAEGVGELELPSGTAWWSVNLRDRETGLIMRVISDCTINAEGDDVMPITRCDVLLKVPGEVVVAELAEPAETGV